MSSVLRAVIAGFDSVAHREPMRPAEVVAIAAGRTSSFCAGDWADGTEKYGSGFELSSVSIGPGYRCLPTMHLTDNHGYLSDVSGTRKYGAAERCSWSIQPNTGRATLRFSRTCFCCVNKVIVMILVSQRPSLIVGQYRRE